MTQADWAADVLGFLGLAFGVLGLIAARAAGKRAAAAEVIAARALELAGGENATAQDG